MNRVILLKGRRANTRLLTLRAFKESYIQVCKKGGNTSIKEATEKLMRGGIIVRD